LRVLQLLGFPDIITQYYLERDFYFPVDKFVNWERLDVANFVPPTYLERICIVINEADNLAQNRASEVAQYNNKTEHILGLLDGTLYQSVIDDSGIQIKQCLVVLMTCNTTERLDPAMLRKGRVDLMYEFMQRFV
jgi:ATP-dependent Zn protease